MQQDDDCELQLSQCQEASESDDPSDESGVKDSFEDLCDELKLEASVFDASIVTPLWRKRTTTRARVWFWAFLSFFFQFGTSFFLYKQLDDSLAPEPDFFNIGDDPATGCSWVSAKDAASSGIFDDITILPGGKMMVCVQKEILQMRKFAVLDTNGDGRWTYDEALSLGDRLPKAYLTLMTLLQQYAQKTPTIPCGPGDKVSAYVDWKGYAYPMKIIGQQVVSGGGMIVRQLETGEFFKVDAMHLYKLDDFSVNCRVATCIDTDFGRTDKGGGPCSWYFWEGMNQGADIPGAKLGKNDDDDFIARDMCCFLGGGSFSANNTALQQLPISLAVEDVLDVQAYHTCSESMGQKKCLANHSSLPAEFFEEEIAPLMDICMIQDVDLCENLVSRQAWQQFQYLDNFVHRAMDNLTVPLFLKMSSSLDETSDLQPLHVCKSIVNDVCPALFPDYRKWNAQRLQTCGTSSTASANGGAMVHYSKSDLYNGEMAVRSKLFQIFLAWIVLLWALAMLPEFRQMQLWWEVFLGMPTAQAGSESVAKLSTGQYALVAMPRGYRMAVGILIMVPETCLLVFIYVLGIQYLFVVRDISDLILNSLALTFLITIDDMLFLAFGDAYSKHLIENMEPIRRQPSWSFLSTCTQKLSDSRIPMGIAIFIPMLLMVAGLFYKEVVQVDTMGDLLHCWCEVAGDQCFVAKALAHD